MHSCEFCVKDDWLRHYQTTLRRLLWQFSHVPQMAAVGQQIEEVSMFACMCNITTAAAAAVAAAHDDEDGGDDDDAAVTFVQRSSQVPVASVLFCVTVCVHVLVVCPDADR